MSDTGMVLKIVEIVISEEFVSKWYTFQQIAVLQTTAINKLITVLILFLQSGHLAFAK